MIRYVLNLIVRDNISWYVTGGNDIWIEHFRFHDMLTGIAWEALSVEENEQKNQ